MSDQVYEQEHSEPAVQSQKPRRHKVLFSFGILIAIAIVIGSVKVISARTNVGMGFLGLAIAFIFFFAWWRSSDPHASQVWNIVGTTIATLFVIGGLMVTGFIILIIIAFSSWGGGGLGGGFGGGSGK